MIISYPLQMKIAISLFAFLQWHYFCWPREANVNVERGTTMR